MFARIFIGLYDLFKSRRYLLYVFFFALTLLFAFCSSRLVFEQDVEQLLPNSQALKAINQAAGNTRAADQVLFLLHDKAADEVKLITAAEELHKHLQTYNALFDTVQLQPASGMEEEVLPFIQQYYPLLLDSTDYNIQTLTKEHISNRLSESKRILQSPASYYYKQLITSDPLGFSSSIYHKLQWTQFDSGFENIEGYLFADSGRTLIFSATVTKNSANEKTPIALNDAIAQVASSFSTSYPEIALYTYGGPLVAAGNAIQLQKDTILTLSITILLLLAVCIYFFRSIRLPLLILIPVVVGALFGLSVVYWIKGSIALMALGAGAIVLGIAVDFGLHFLAHSRHSSSPKQLIKDLAQPITLGSLTTVCAFLILLLAETPVLQDFGLFAGSSLVGAALTTLIFLPHLVLTSSSKSKTQSENIFDRLGKWKPERKKWLIAAIFILTPLFWYKSFQVEFDSDLMNLNFRSKSLKSAEDYLARISPGTLNSVYLVAEGATEEEALQRLEEKNLLIEKWVSEGKITAASYPTLLIPSHETQLRRITQWSAYWTPERIAILESDLRLAAKENGFAESAFDDFLAQLKMPPALPASEEIEQVKSLFPGGFAKDDDLEYAISALKVPEYYRQWLLSQFEHEQHLVLTDRRESSSQLAQLLKEDFNRIALYSSLIVFLALLIAYGRIELALMSFLPMLISWVWILGIMALLGIPFNIVNIVISTLIFGLGDDYSIFTMDGLIERYQHGSQKVQSVRSAIYVSCFTTLIGLGVLLLASHPALKSVALLSVPGMICVLIISQTLQPFLFNWFVESRARKGFRPFTLKSFLISVFAFTYFFTGSMVLTIIGFVVVKSGLFPKDKGKKILHTWLSRFTWSMMYIMGNMRKRIVHHGPKANFNRPAIYIANHSSFLDILGTTMLTPKMILLTNRWVWKSPVFGKVVQMADYYPVADGASDSVEPLRDLVQKGYNIMVFPEGTRSHSDKIYRFKKGAFYLSEELKMDIVPVILHGFHYNMQKGDWMLKSGTASVHLFPRISPEDKSYGTTYSARTKEINRWMRQQLKLIKEKDETPAYFRHQLIHCYLYKGPVLEWYCRIKSKLENNYEPFHQLLPKEGLIYDLGCGYGFLSYMLRWSAEGRVLKGIDYDEEKISTAQNVYLRDAHIEFEQADLTLFTPESCSGIVINDVLHYLLPEQQMNLMNKCAASLKPGGTLIIRDGIAEMSKKLKGTKLTELFSTRIFSFNKTKNELHYLSRKTLEDWAAEQDLHCRILDQTKYTSNVIFIFSKPEQKEKAIAI